MVQPARARGHSQPWQRAGQLGAPAPAAGRALHEVLPLGCTACMLWNDQVLSSTSLAPALIAHHHHLCVSLSPCSVWPHHDRISLWCRPDRLAPAAAAFVHDILGPAFAAALQPSVSYAISKEPAQPSTLVLAQPRGQPAEAPSLLLASEGQTASVDTVAAGGGQVSLAHCSSCARAPSLLLAP